MRMTEYHRYDPRILITAKYVDLNAYHAYFLDPIQIS